MTALTTVPSLGKSRIYFQKYDSNILKTIIDFKQDEILSIREELHNRKQAQSSETQQEGKQNTGYLASHKRSNSRGRLSASQNNSSSNGKGLGLNRRDTSSATKGSDTKETNSEDLIYSFSQLKQAIQTFHDRRRNMESIITRRASQAQAQAQAHTRMDMMNSTNQNNSYGSLGHNTNTNNNNNNTGSGGSNNNPNSNNNNATAGPGTDRQFGSMGPGDVKSPEMFRQQQHYNNQSYKNQRGF